MAFRLPALEAAQWHGWNASLDYRCGGSTGLVTCFPNAWQRTVMITKIIKIMNHLQNHPLLLDVA